MSNFPAALFEGMTPVLDTITAAGQWCIALSLPDGGKGFLVVEDVPLLKQQRFIVYLPAPAVDAAPELTWRSTYHRDGEEVIQDGRLRARVRVEGASVVAAVFEGALGDRAALTLESRFSPASAEVFQEAKRWCEERLALIAEQPPTSPPASGWREDHDCKSWVFEIEGVVRAEIYEREAHDSEPGDGHCLVARYRRTGWRHAQVFPLDHDFSAQMEKAKRWCEQGLAAPEGAGGGV